MAGERSTDRLASGASKAMLDSDTQSDKREVSTDDNNQTNFDLLEGADGRLFLEIHTTNVHYVVELDEREVDELCERLDEPPTPTRFSEM
jgi:hypothetical protein